MAMINYYNGLSNKREIIRGVGKVCDLMQGKDFSHSVILVAGHKVSPDYEVKENDIVFVRDTPSEALSTVMIVISIIVAVAGLAAGIYGAVKNKELQEKLEKAQKANKAVDTSSPDALPFLKGATNQPATGRTFPLVMGEHYFTPYRLAPKYYEIAGDRGEREYTNIILEAGFSPLVIKELKLGEHIIYTNESDNPSNIFTTFPENSIYYDEENVIEIKQDEEFNSDCFKKKIVSDYVMNEIKHDYGTEEEEIPYLIQDCQPHAKSIDVCILFNGLRKLVNNSWQSQSVTINCWWSNINSPDPNNPEHWHPIGFNVPVKSGYITHTARFKVSVSYKKTGDTNTYTGQVLSDSIVYSLVSNSMDSWVKTGGEEIDFDTMKYNSLRIISNNCKAYNIINQDSPIGSGHNVTRFTYYSGEVVFDADYLEDDYTIGTTNVFDFNSKRQMRFIAHKDFTPEESYNKNITVMLKRMTSCAESNSQEDCYLSFINTEIYDVKKSSLDELISCKLLEDEFIPKCCRIGIRMKASDVTQDLSNSVNVVAYGCARVWNEETGWSEIKVPTRNPAAWALELLTSDIHGLSKYSDEEIDLDSCARLYRYCENYRFFCDAVIIEPITKNDIISNILSSCNASLIINNEGKLEFLYDDEELYPVALLNTQDIVDVTITKKMQRQSTGKKVSFINHDSWIVDSRYCMSDGTENHSPSDTITEIAPQYVTDPSHAWRYARRQLIAENYQTREVSVTVGNEGGYYPLYSCVDIQLPHLSVGITSAQIVSLSIHDGVLTEIELDQEVEFVEGKNYGLIAFVVKAGEKGFFTAKVVGLGRTKYLEVLDYNGVAPIAGNILSFGLLDDDGEFSLITTRMKIYNIRRSDGGYKLTLKDYNSDLYSEDGEIPEFHSNATITPTSRIELDTVPDAVRDALDEQQEQMKDLVDSIGFYTFDVTPEYQTVACNSEGYPIGTQQFRFTATVYRSSKPYEGSVTYIAKSQNRVVGSWVGNVLTLDTSVIIAESNDILITAETDDGYKFEAAVTIAKLRAGDAGDAKYTIYDIGLSDPIIKVDAEGTNPDPNHIIPKKLKKTEAYTVETDYGYITASVDGGEESVVSSYTKVQQAEVFDPSTTYYRRATPFYLSLDGDALCLNDIVMIAFKE